MVKTNLKFIFPLFTVFTMYKGYMCLNYYFGTALVSILQRSESVNIDVIIWIYLAHHFIFLKSTSNLQNNLNNTTNT